jgi:gamma-butyrobetaine dioxygenase
MPDPDVPPAADVADVLALFETWGTSTYDEDVSQLDHALQTAALARSAGAGAPLVAAALLHDVGHLLELRDGGRADGQTDIDLGHEARGARWLAPVFPAGVTGPIALHVAAKRYRCAVDPAYHDGLSEGSRRSLVRQGGPMSAEEAERFARHPAHADAVALRGWDDGGKVEELDVADLASYRELLERLAR